LCPRRQCSVRVGLQKKKNEQRVATEEITKLGGSQPGFWGRKIQCCILPHGRKSNSWKSYPFEDFQNRRIFARVLELLAERFDHIVNDGLI
jgi:hypothetical protein